MAYKGTYALNFPGEEVMCVMLGNEMTGFRKSGKQIDGGYLQCSPLFLLISIEIHPFPFYCLLEKSVPINLPDILMDNSLRKSFLPSYHDEFGY